MILKKRYRKYVTGGGMSQNMGNDMSNTGRDVSQALNMVGGVADSLDTGNQYGRKKTGTTVLKGAATGASIGTSIVPGWGTAIGAIVGAGAGLIMDKQNRKAEREMIFGQKLSMQQQELNRSAAIIGTNPALVTGQPGEEYYAMGGFLKSRYDTMKTSGGKLDTMSSQSAEVEGPSHENGGVDIPQYQSELEGGETIQGDYVFSKRLGFADIHKKLARNIGKIEQKPATPDRINALKAMNQQVQQLQQLQEQIRQQNNLQ